METTNDTVQPETVKEEETKPAVKPVPPEGSVDDEDDDCGNPDDDDAAAEEGAQEEDALFTALEHSEEEKEAQLPHDQPTDVHVAPTLLKSALETGQVKSDSEDEAKEEKKPEHVHSRVSTCK